MEWIKSIVMIVLYLGGSCAIAQSSYSEETGTLESIYESRARAALNTLLRPEEYTLIISAELEKDEFKLQAYREKLELEYLPGLPVPGDASLKPATNNLHEMKSRVTVNLVLSPEVPAEKETVLKTILINKLHLDETNGDVISIARAPFPKDPKPEPQPPSIFPELTWKTWALIVLLALIALAGLMYYVSKKSQIDSTEEERDEPQEKLREEPTTALEALPPAKHEPLPEVVAISEKDLEHERDCILNLATQYPQICARVAVTMIENERTDQLIIVFNDIGWDLSKKIMSEIPPRAWARMGHKVRQHQHKPNGDELFQALTETHKEFLAGVLESGALSDEQNPFAFLAKATASERYEVLRGESATNLAVLSFFLNAEEIRDIFERLEPEMQAQVTSAMSRLQSLPDAILKKLSNHLLMKLTNFRKEPVTTVDGAGVAGKTLRAMSPDKEAEVFASLMDSNPDEAEKIRRIYLQFVDLPVLPKDAVALALSETEVGDVAQAFKDQPKTFVEGLLKLVPPKRANMIRRDLESPNNVADSAQQWAARRRLVLRIENYFKQQGFTIKNIWDQIDRSNETTQGDRRAS